MTLQYKRNERFVGREAELAEIHRGLFGAVPADRGSSVLLHGLGGLGKTQLALEYAYRHREKFSAIFWIDAQDQWSLQASFLGIVQGLVDHYITQFQDAEQPYSQASRYLGLSTILDENSKINPKYVSLQIAGQAVTEWLSRGGNNRWLLIIDDVDEIDESRLSEFLPCMPWGRRIITSRLRDCVQCEYAIDVPLLSMRESIVLFSAHSGEPWKPGNKHG